MVLALATQITPAVSTGNWPMYGVDLGHTGFNPNETTLTQTNVSGLTLLWAFDIGAVTAQPVYASNVNVAGVLKNIIYVGDSRNYFYAFDIETGQLIWWREFPILYTACGRVAGIDSAATFDAAANTIYVADGANNLHALDMSTGADKWTVQITSDLNSHVFSAVVEDPSSKILYVQKGQYCEDFPGHVTDGEILSFYASSGVQIGSFSAGDPANDVYGGGMWGVGGPAIDPTNGAVYSATGNVPPVTTSGFESEAYGEHIFRFAASTLKLIDGNAPISPPWVPSDPWDLDLGSSPMLAPAGAACPNLLTIEQKSGQLWVYDKTLLGILTVNGKQMGGPKQGIQVGTSSDSGHFIGTTAYWPAGYNGNNTAMVYATSPDAANGSYNGSFDPPNLNYTQPAGTAMNAGLTAFTVGSDCLLHFAWNTPTPSSDLVLYGSAPNPPPSGPPNYLTEDAPFSNPSIANGVVYYADGGGQSIHAINAQTGVQLWQSPKLANVADFKLQATGQPITDPNYANYHTFATPMIADGRLVVSTWRPGAGSDFAGTIFVFGLP